MTNIPPVPTSADVAVRAANLGAGGVRVDPEALLNARNVIQSEADRLKDMMRFHQRQLAVGVCGADPISQPAANAFNRRIQTMVREANEFVKSLTAAADHLGLAAKSYGTTEDQARAAFAAFQKQQREGSPPVSNLQFPGVPIAPADPASAALGPYVPPHAVARAPGDLRPLIDHSAHGPTGLPNGGGR